MLETREARNTDVFVEHYEGIYKEMYEQAYRSLGNREEASEAISDTILDAYTTFDDLQDIDDFQNWMFAILTGKCSRISEHNDNMVVVGSSADYDYTNYQSNKESLRKEVESLRRDMERSADPDMVNYRRIRFGNRHLWGVVGKVAIGLGVAIVFTFVSFTYIMMML